MTEVLRNNQRSYEQKYPIFAFDWSDSDYCAYSHRGAVNYEHFFPLAWDADRIERSLRGEHCKVATRIRLESRYSDVCIFLAETQDGYMVTVGVKRSGKVAEAMLSSGLMLESPELHAVLSRLQGAAIESKREGWFYCNGHAQPEPISAGQCVSYGALFCNGWGDKDRIR